MPRPEGSGRAPGTPNKRSREFRERLDELSAQHGLDLIECLVLTSMGADPYFPAPELGPGPVPADLMPLVIAREQDNRTHAMTARKLLLQYGYPALKAVEYTGADGGPARFAFVIESNAPAPANVGQAEPEDPLS